MCESDVIHLCNYLKYFDYFYGKQMYMSISERLQMVIKMNGMTNASFADEIGVQRSSISHVLAGRNKPSIDFIQKILVAFPKVNADWLVTGKKIGRTIESENTSDVREESIVKDESIQEESSVQEEEPITNKGRSKGESEDTSVNDGLPRITKILVFYDDGTFEETVPRR